tara:strand:- start:55 stop:1413 length:1359 start_codon:yes stop_codon:yes gene_type:complete
MKKKTIVTIVIITAIISISTFISLWNLVSDNYDKQNKLILALKKIIPREIAVSVRDIIFVIPKIKTENKLLQLQVDKYEQGLEGTLFNKQKILSDKKIDFLFKEFFLPFKKLDISQGWNKLSNTFRAHYLEVIDDKVLVLSGEGQTIYFDKNNIYNNKLSQKNIKNNIYELASKNNFKFMGVRDILYDSEKIYISLIFKNNQGFSMNVYVADYNLNFLNFSLFFKTGEYSEKYNIQTGGRLEKFNKEKILLSTGTANELILNAQNKNSTTGKILLIDKNSRKYEVISLGHRNPQGLQYLKEFNIVINSEHGPKGGDEINFNQLFTDLPKNFGWPISSYGTPYDKKKEDYKKSHKDYGFEEPIKVFTPAIGISEIQFININNKFGNYNALLVSSLRASSVYIIYFDENLNIVNEMDRIFFSGQRIRDLEYDKETNHLFMIFEVTPSIGVLDFN